METDYKSKDRFSEWPAPIIVGGVGGSGTRLLMTFLEGLGVYLGKNLNESKDAIDFVEIYDEFVPKVLKSNDLSVTEKQSLRQAFLNSVENYLTGAPLKCIWAFKNPRSIYLWPYIKHLFPGAKFIHLIRDGVVMSNSTNTNQYDFYAKFLLSTEELGVLKDRDKKLLFWARAMKWLEEFQDENSGSCLLLRFEDLIQHPQRSLTLIEDFLGLQTNCENLLAKVTLQPSRGRGSYPFTFSGTQRREVDSMLMDYGYSKC